MSETNRMTYNRRVVEEFRANGGKVQGWAPPSFSPPQGPNRVKRASIP